MTEPFAIQTTYGMATVYGWQLLWIPHLNNELNACSLFYLCIYELSTVSLEALDFYTSRILCGNFHPVNIFVQRSFLLCIFIRSIFPTNFTFYCASDWIECFKIELLTHFQWGFFTAFFYSNEWNRKSVVYVMNSTDSMPVCFSRGILNLWVSNCDTGFIFSFILNSKIYESVQKKKQNYV